MIAHTIRRFTEYRKEPQGSGTVAWAGEEHTGFTLSIIWVD